MHIKRKLVAAGLLAMLAMASMQAQADLTKPIRDLYCKLNPAACYQ